MPFALAGGAVRYRLPWQEVDVTSAPLTRYEPREAVIDFTTVEIYLEYTTIMVAMPSADGDRLHLFTQPFSRSVWLAVVACVPVMGVALWVCAYAFARLAPAAAPPQPRPRDHDTLTTITYAIWFAFASILKQGEATPSFATITVLQGIDCGRPLEMHADIVCNNLDIVMPTHNICIRLS